MTRKALIILLTLSLFSIAHALEKESKELARPQERGVTALKVPESYDSFLQQEKEKQVLVPERAKNAKNTEDFFSSVLDFQVKKYLKNNPDSKLNKVKEVEQQLNNGAGIETEDFKIKSKLNLIKGHAEIDMHYLLDYRIWFADRFQSVNAEIDFYSTQYTRFGLDYRQDAEDSRTQLGFRIIW